VRVVFASRNRHKLEQVAALLSSIEIVPLDEIAPHLVLEEPYETFEENAFSKARAVVSATGEPALADDSGLEVDALGGAPGVRSARWSGESADDDDNNRKLVAALESVPEDKRTCRYRCVAVLVTPTGTELLGRGTLEGRIELQGRGTLGFGYDPHVIPIPAAGSTETRTMAEISLREKLSYSHRGRAFRSLAAQLEKIDEPPAREHGR
jgi:XTP/dITP diphosphohydrolase